MVVKEDEAAGSVVVGRIEREKGATTLSSSVLGNLDGIGRQIDDCKRTHWYLPRNL